MADTANDLEEGHARLVPISSFERRLARQGLGRSAVEDECRCGHCLTLEPCQYAFGLHHGSSHANHRLVPSLYHTILLWRVQRGVVSPHTLIRAVRNELHRSEFATTISPQHAQLLVALRLRVRLELLDRFHRLGLAGQKLQPHVPAAVIHQQDEVLAPAGRPWRDRPTEVTMD